MSRKHFTPTPEAVKSDDRSNPSKSPPRIPQQEPTHDVICRRAYQKWEEAGWPDGQSDRFWLEAERELQVQGDETIR